MIETFKNKMEKLSNELSKEQLSNIHYRSVNNFLQYFNQLKSDSIKQQIIILFEDYFSEIEKMNYQFTDAESSQIFRKYIMQIGTFYNCYLNFQTYMKPKWALFIGLNADLILLIFGVLKKVYYIPVVTVLFCGYFIYLKLRYERKNKLYGPGY